MNIILNINVFIDLNSWNDYAKYIKLCNGSNYNMKHENPVQVLGEKSCNHNVI